jgi:hypothetical protein
VDNSESDSTGGRNRAELQMRVIAEKLTTKLKAFQAVELLLPEDVVFATVLYGP